MELNRRMVMAAAFGCFIPSAVASKDLVVGYIERVYPPFTGPMEWGSLQPCVYADWYKNLSRAGRKNLLKQGYRLRKEVVDNGFLDSEIAAVHGYVVQHIKEGKVIGKEIERAWFVVD